MGGGKERRKGWTNYGKRTNKPTNQRPQKSTERKGMQVQEREREGDGKRKCVRERKIEAEKEDFLAREKKERKKNGWNEYTTKRRTKIVKETNLLALFDVQQKLANLLQLHYNMQYQSRIQYMA